jgi:hypothetical protein
MLDGKVEVRHHNMDDPFDFELIQVAKIGDILGVPDIDCGNSSMPNAINIATSSRVFVAKIPKRDFD